MPRSRRSSCSGGSSNGARTPLPAHRSSSPSCARRASSTRAAPGSSSSFAASPPRLRASPCPRRRPTTHTSAGVDAIHLEESKYRYCTVFVVEGEGLDPRPLEDELERFGDSLLVVGDATALKIHVHTDDPGRALALGTALGAIEGVEIANMHASGGRALGAPARTGSRSATHARDRRRRGRARRRKQAPVRELRGGARARGRPDDESVDRRPPRRDRGHAGDRGARPAEQLERDPLGGAGRRHGDEAGARDPVALRSRRPRGDHPVSAGGRRGARTRARCSTRSGTSRPAR